MHFVDIRCRVALRSEKRFDNVSIVDDGGERNDITEVNRRSRFGVIRFVLLYAGVPQRNFLLVVQPIRIVRTQASI